MDHKYINEFDIVERYLTRKLAAEETSEFEEHFVDCLECVDRLETTKAFIEGLRGVASDRRAAVVSGESKADLGNVGYTMSRKAFAVAAGVLSLIVIAGAVLFLAQIRRYRIDADQARSASTQWENRYEEQRQLSATESKGHEESERELAEQVAQLRTELENQRKPEPHDDVQVNLPILVLSTTRSSEPQSASANKLTLPRSSSTFVITFALEGERGYRDYIMTIAGSQKELIWKGRGIKANRDNAISVGFNSALFHPGDYLLTLDGVAGDGSTSVVGKYPFHVLKTP